MYGPDTLGAVSTMGEGVETVLLTCLPAHNAHSCIFALHWTPLGPIASCAISMPRRWKPLHHVVKRSFAPVVVTGVLDEDIIQVMIVLSPRCMTLRSPALDVVQSAGLHLIQSEVGSVRESHRSATSLDGGPYVKFCVAAIFGGRTLLRSGLRVIVRGWPREEQQ